MRQKMAEGFTRWTAHIRAKCPEILTLMLCLAVLAAGVLRKEGYHMDELLSFELSNAQFTPWIVPTQPEGRLAKFVRLEVKGDSLGETAGNLKRILQDVAANRGDSRLLSYKADVYEEPVWISSKQFQDYITVDGEDAFNYLSVYFNVKDDNHPPLHFMLLHTMSSLFRGKVSPFVGCSINLAAVAGILALLMGLGRRFGMVFLGTEGRARLLGIMAALVYGLSAGAVAAALLIRMYAMLAFFCVALFAIHVKKWQENGFGQHNKLLILVTALGFWTQYFFLFYCLILAAVTAALLFVHKKYRDLWIYVRSMMTAGAVGIALFPFAVSDVFSSGRGVEALENLSAGLAGYGERLFSFGRIVADRTLGKLLLPILVLLGFGILLQAFWGRKGSGKAGGSGRALLCLLFLPAAGYFLLAARMSPYLVDRYMMPLFPFVAFGAVLLVFLTLNGRVWARSGGRRDFSPEYQRIYVCAACAVLVLWQAAGLCRYDGAYLYRGYSLQEKMAQEYASYPCICVYEGVGYYENLIEFTCYDKTLLVRAEELKDRKERESIASLEQVVVLVKQGVDWNETADILETEYGLSFDRWMFRESVYGDVAGVFVR